MVVKVGSRGVTLIRQNVHSGPKTLHPFSMFRFFSFILKKFSPPKPQDMSTRKMPLLRMSKREAFARGFFTVFGLNSFSVESQIRSDIDAIREDFFVISEDTSRVFAKQAKNKESSELVVQDEQK